MTLQTTPATNPAPDEKPAAKDFHPYEQSEVTYVQVSEKRGQMCQNCRWFRGYTCAIVRDHAPKDIVNTGWCNQWTVEPSETEVAVMPVLVVPDGTGLSTYMSTMGTGTMAADGGGTLTPEGGGSYYRAPPSNIIVKGKTEPALQKQTIFKDATGRRYMLITTSNGYQDREEEWIPAAELKAYVESCWIDEKTFQSDNPLLFWHNDELVAGDIIWASMQGNFLMELAREGDTAIAKALWDYREKNPDNELWGASHRFRYRSRSAEGVYKGVRKEETTFLPLWAAANLLTMSEVITVSKSHDDYLNKMFATFNVPNAAELLRSGHQKLEDALTSAGHSAKSADGTPAAPLFSKEAASLIVQLVDAQSDMATRLEAIETKAKEGPVVPPELVATINKLDAGISQIQKALEIDPTQASTDPDTELDADDPAAKNAKKEFDQKEAGGQYDNAFPGMRVPLNGGKRS